MSTDNNNLEDMVEKTLESTGVLPKMRAELRVKVFQVLEKGSSFQEQLFTTKIKDFLSNKNGTLMLSLVKDLFEYLELTFTSSVFEPETGAGHHYEYINKDDICDSLSLSKDDKRPLLLQILETHQLNSKAADENVKKYTTQNNDKTHEGSSLAKILKHNTDSAKAVLDDKPNITSLNKTNLFEQNVIHENSVSSSNPNSSDNVQLKDLDSSASLNCLNIEKLSPFQKPTDHNNDNTDDDVESDLKSNKNESSLEDIETDENVSCGNDSLPSTDLSTQNGSPEIIKTRNLHL